MNGFNVGSVVAAVRGNDEFEADVMPETNYKAAIAVINRWQNEFPDTYAKFEQEIDKPAKLFIEELADYSITAYEKFEKMVTNSFDSPCNNVFNRL